MTKLIPMVTAAVLAMGATAVAAEGSASQGATGADTQHGVRMQGSPNAAGYPGKSDTTGTTNTGAPGSEMPRQGGRMTGSPNAAGFQDGNTGVSGKR